MGVSVTPVNLDDGNVYIGMASDSGTHVAQGRFPRRNPQWVIQRSATTAIVQLLAALSTDLDMLVVARVFQAIGAGARFLAELAPAYAAHFGATGAGQLRGGIHPS